MRAPSPSNPDQSWPARQAIRLTLVVLAIPTVVAVTAALHIGPAGLLAMPAVYVPPVLAATQRLVRFMLTGEIQPCDRTRFLNSGDRR